MSFLSSFCLRCYRSAKGSLLLGSLLLGLAACQPGQPGEAAAGAGGPPPVGHYEGSINVAGRAEARAALDIRHPSPGHYEAELTVPGAPALSFVGDTIFFVNRELRLVRPGRPGQVLRLKLDGDFWHGTLQLDSLKAETLLVKRGPPPPNTYRVEELPQDQASAWLFSPADTGTPGPALALLPDSATAPAAALWADALAREGVIVLVLRNTPGADSATIGVWAAGRRARTLAQELTTPAGPQVAFFISQQVEVSTAARTDFRELARRKLPVLGLYGGATAVSQAGKLKAALGRRAAVRSYRNAGPDLLVPGPLSARFGPGLPDEVINWLRER